MRATIRTIVPINTRMMRVAFTTEEVDKGDTAFGFTTIYITLTSLST